ncbi:MAG TPA: hypothetical protein PKW15_00160 [Alphaproteobacteria bacterium]|nr:hypothetical protein [Alphaproteobacteria bacterium]
MNAIAKKALSLTALTTIAMGLVGCGGSGGGAGGSVDLTQADKNAAEFGTAYQALRVDSSKANSDKLSTITGLETNAPVAKNFTEMAAAQDGQKFWVLNPGNENQLFYAHRSGDRFYQSYFTFGGNPRNGNAYSVRYGFGQTQVDGQTTDFKLSNNTDNGNLWDKLLALGAKNGVEIGNGTVDAPTASAAFVAAAEAGTAFRAADYAKLSILLDLPTNAPVANNFDEMNAAPNGSKMWVKNPANPNQLFYAVKDGKNTHQIYVTFGANPEYGNKYSIRFGHGQLQIEGLPGLYRLKDTAANGNLKSRLDAIGAKNGIEVTNESQDPPPPNPVYVAAAEVGAAFTSAKQTGNYNQLATLLGVTTNTSVANNFLEMENKPDGSKFFVRNPGNENQLFYVVREGNTLHQFYVTFGANPEFDNAYSIRAGHGQSQVLGVPGTNPLVNTPANGNLWNVLKGYGPKFGAAIDNEGGGLAFKFRKDSFPFTV